MTGGVSHWTCFLCRYPLGKWSGLGMVHEIVSDVMSSCPDNTILTNLWLLNAH